MQKPFGIGNFRLNISPKEAAFPPTLGRLLILISLNQRINSPLFFMIIRKFMILKVYLIWINPYIFLFVLKFMSKALEEIPEVK